MQNQQQQHLYHQQPPPGGVLHPSYTYPATQNTAINPALAVGQQPIQHTGHQPVNQSDASQYHQLQSSAHHAASPYYRNLYPNYPQHAHHPDQSHYYQASEHHHSSTVPPVGANSASVSGAAPQISSQQSQKQHLYHSQSATGPSQPSAALNNNTWTNLGPPGQTHSSLNATSDIPATGSGYSVSPYPGQNPTVSDQHLANTNPIRPSVSSSVGNSSALHSTSTYPMDPLYTSSVADSYNYSGYGSAQYRSSANGHTQAGLPNSDLTSFWRAGQSATQMTNQANITKRVNEQQSAPTAYDPSSYYNRSTYSHTIPGFNQTPIMHPMQPNEASQHRLAPVATTGGPSSSSQINIPPPQHDRLSQPAQHSMHPNQPGVNQQNQYLSPHGQASSQYMSPLPAYQTHNQQMSQSSPMMQQYSPMSQLASMSRDVAGSQMLSPKKSNQKIDATESNSSTKWTESGISDPTMTPLMTPGSYQQSNLYSQQQSDSIGPTPSETNDPYALDPQTFEDYDDQPQSKTKKGRPKKTDGDAKKEKKPRAQRAPKGQSVASKGKKIKTQSTEAADESLSKEPGPSNYQAPFNYPGKNSYSNIDSNVPQNTERSQISPSIAISQLESTQDILNTSRPNNEFQSKDQFEQVFAPMTSTPTMSNIVTQDISISQPISQLDSATDKIGRSPKSSKSPNKIEKSSTKSTPASSPTLTKSTTPTGPLFLQTSTQEEVLQPLTPVETDIAQSTNHENSVQFSLPADEIEPNKSTEIEPNISETGDSNKTQQEDVSIGIAEEKSEEISCTKEKKKRERKPSKEGDEKKDRKEKKPRSRNPKKANSESSKKKRTRNQSKIEVVDKDAGENQEVTTTDLPNNTINDDTLMINDKSMDTTMTSQSLDETQETKPDDVETVKRVRPPRYRDPNSRKKKLPKFALKFSKTKKRKRLNSSDNEPSDLEKTPPPSPDEVESGVQKRRSTRNTKKLRYNDDLELGLSESDDDSLLLPKASASADNTENQPGTEPTKDASLVSTRDEPSMFAAPVEDTMVVEKVMSSRMGKRELEPDEGEILPPDGTHIDVEEFYVKFKNLSYLHCDWRTLEELERGDRRVAQKLKRFKQKKDSSNMFSFMDEELFDLQYCEVDRILALNEVEELVPDEEDLVNKKPVVTDISTNIDEKDTKIDEKDTKIDEKDTKIDEKDTKIDESTPDQVTTKVIKDGEISVEAVEDKNPTVFDTKSELKTETLEHDSIDASTTQVRESCIVSPLDSDKTQQCGIPNKTDPVEANAKDVKESDDNVASSVGKPLKMKKKISRHFLVKWRGLSYEESTWELEDDLDPEKIKQFMRFKDPPPKSKWRHVKRPKPDEWVRKESSPVYKNGNTLREYQLEGINWLSFCWHQGRNCILADEMGLGKTIQSIAFVNEIYERGIYGPFLIIVPLSTVGNWAREFETWTDLNVITYHGSSASREMLKEYEMFYRNEQGNRITSYYKFQVMITTFEIILSDCLDLREIPWRCCIIDEAHRLKNRNCKLLEGLRLLNMEHRVLLTGTPLQNNVEELFSLLNFLEPNQFASTEQFLEEFGDLKTEAQVDKLKLILKPMMLRRLKEDVEKSLAPKEETIVEVELTNIQKKYYRAILEKNFSFLSKGGGSTSNIPNLMNTMMELRKCCIHPYLINGAEEQILYEAKQAKHNGGESLSSFQAMVNASGKLVLIDKLLPRLRADGHRVLIFSQMVRCLDILEDYITHKHYPFERIDGRVRGSERQQAIDRFSKPGSDRFVFLLCTRAGGLGINLTAADTVIIFDSDWNPQNDLQAQARCHRIGQSKAVKIYRLICRNTYEREMFDKASLKLGLDKAVLQSMNTQKGGAGGIDGQLTKKEIEELLRKGAYGALMDDDNAGDKFCEEDIDQILLRRTQVITIDNSEAKGSTFSKATFSSSSNREDIDIDDPNFWEKWAKKANLDADDLKNKDELIVHEPRRRTQTRRYGEDGHLIEISDFESSDEDEETISMRTRGSRGRNSKTTPITNAKRNKRHRFLDDDDYSEENNSNLFTKGECFKVEKGLLTYGWGRWSEIVSKVNFRREKNPDECENIARVMLLYCLNSYKGDEKIKSFIWDLITPVESNKQQEPEINISTRGRRPKSAAAPVKKTVFEEMIDAKWTKDPKYNPNDILVDEQYKKHLQRNSNRLIIRVKFLHYLKNDIFKDQLDKIFADSDHSEIELQPILVDGELPSHWWDDEADKSLLIGVLKHGHDKFNIIRQDPKLCFLSRCGPPDSSELNAELNNTDDPSRIIDEDMNESKTALLSMIDSKTSRLVKRMTKRDLELRNESAGEILSELIDIVDHEVMTSIIHKPINIDENKNDISSHVKEDHHPSNETQETALSFPSFNDLNQRFRRLITAHQRNSKKIEIQLAQKARDELKRERTSKFEAAKNEREERKRSQAQKWSRREEADFFRTISSFGVEYDSVNGKKDWNKFRTMAKLEKKLDETMDEYYKAFVGMCKRVTSKPLNQDEQKCNLKVEPITEDRALKCLSRLELLNKIRQKVVTNSHLEARIKKSKPSSDLPDWWIPVRHDRDLLMAASKLGLSRLDYNIAHDSSFSFAEIIDQKAMSLLSSPPSPIAISLDRLEELLKINGIQYEKEFNEDLDESNEYKDDIYQILDSMISSIEKQDGEGCQNKTSKNMFKNINQNNSRTCSNSTGRNGSVIVLSAKDIGPNPSVITIKSSDITRGLDHRFVEVRPIIPKIELESFEKNFESGEVTISIVTDLAIIDTIDSSPIALFGGDFQVTSKIRWPKDKIIQSRLEHLAHLVEKGEWKNSKSNVQANVPTHLNTSINQSSPSVSNTHLKTDKIEPVGSPTSDISSISSKTSKNQKDKVIEPRPRRGRGRKPKNISEDRDDKVPKSNIPVLDEGQAAKLRNLLSQGTTLTESTPTNERLVAKFGGTKPNSGLSSLLATFKQKKSESGPAQSRVDNNNPFDLNFIKNSPNLIPQLLANMKPEFRDLLANQDTANLLLNSLTSLTGSPVPNLRSSTSSNPTKGSSKTNGPPPAHQRASGAQSSSETPPSRDSRRNQIEPSQPSFNLRSMKGKSSPVHQPKPDNTRQQPQRKRGRPSSSASNEHGSLIGPDVLDLSSLQLARELSFQRQESRSRRQRGSNDDESDLHSSLKPSRSSRTDRAAEQEQQTIETSSVRTTRASKRIGSRIDALALNLQAKKLNTGDNFSGVDSPSSPPRERRSKSGQTSASSGKHEDTAKNPPSAHSSSPAVSSKNQSTKESKLPSLANQSTAPRQTSSINNMSNVPNVASLNNLVSAGLPGQTDLLNQLSRKQNPNDIFKNLFGDLMKNQHLLNPSLLETLASSLSLNPQLLSNFVPPSSKPSTNSIVTNTSPNVSLTQQIQNLNDFKTTNVNSSHSKRTKPLDANTSGDKKSVSGQNERRQTSNSTTNIDKRPSSEKATRKSNTSILETDKRSSASLLAQNSHAVQSAMNNSHQKPATTTQPGLTNPSPNLNLANNIGGLNPLNLLAGFPGMNDFFKQMAGFPGLPLPGTVQTPASNSTNLNSSTLHTPSTGDKAKRSKPGSSNSNQNQSSTPTTSQSSSINMDFASSLMNLAQPNAATNAYYNQLNPFLFPPLNNFNLNMFSNPYLSGFQPAQSDQQSHPNTSNSSSSKDKKMRYSKK